MRDILVLQDSLPQDALIVTSVLRRLLNKDTRIHCVCDPSLLEMFKFCNGILSENIYQTRAAQCKYDLLINFSPMEAYTLLAENINAKEKLGYGSDKQFLKFYNQGAEIHYRTRYIGVPTDANIFQLFYRLAGLVWEGEGYWLNYYPKHRCKKSLIGLAVHNNEWNKTVRGLQLDSQKLWYIPFKKNILKQIDEVNKCKTIITDDLAILHISLALRKNVEFLTKNSPAYRFETFNSGHLHVISDRNSNV